MKNKTFRRKMSKVKMEGKVGIRASGFSVVHVTVGSGLTYSPGKHRGVFCGTPPSINAMEVYVATRKMPRSNYSLDDMVAQENKDEK